LKRLGVRVIDFTGGEPLLHRQLPEMLALARQMGFITTVTTNALLYPKQAERLRGLVDMLHFSLDSSDRDTHDRGRGVACYDFVLESIRVARALGERPDVLLPVFRHNLADLEAVCREITQPNGLVLILNLAFDYNAIETGERLTPAELDFFNLEAARLEQAYYLDDYYDTQRLHSAPGYRTPREVELAYRFPSTLAPRPF